jgi:type II secretory pathway pseudopilin PulG
MNSPQRPGTSGSAAFTLVDLLAVLAALAVCALLWVPALARTQLDTRAFQCLSNARQLALAVQIYQADNHDFFPPNPDDGNQMAGYNWCPGTAGRGSGQEFNSDMLTNATLCLVAPYLRKDAPVFRCPADKRQGMYTGAEPGLLGQVVPAARTVTMNAAVGSVDYVFWLNGSGHGGSLTYPVNGPWLDGSHSHRADHPWKTFGKGTSFAPGSPTRIFLCVEEDSYSLNNANFALDCQGAEWINWLGTYHDMGCVFSFCDGHAEIHRWLDIRTPALNRYFSVPGSVDWAWLAERTSFRVQ